MTSHALALQVPRAYPVHQRVADWLTSGLTEGVDPDPDATLRRVLPLVAASFDAADRLALHHHLWTLWPQVRGQTREAARGWLDGRLAAWCQCLSGAWSADETWQTLAAWHLGGRAGCPTAPEYVLVLLEAHGQTGAGAGPLAQWLAVQAQLDLDTPDLDPAAVDRLLGQTVAAMEAGVAPWAQGMARLFELAVRAGNAVLADEMLERCVRGGAAMALSPRWLRCWIDGTGVGTAAAPLWLKEPLQSQWLQPARLADPAWRARLHASLHRRAARDRVRRLEELLGGAAAEPVPDAPCWQLLGALDACFDLAERGESVALAARALLEGGALAPAAAAALCRVLALQAMDCGDVAAAFRVLAEARAVDSDGPSRRWLSALLELLGGADALCAALDAGSDGAAGSVEMALWAQWVVAPPDTVPPLLHTLARAMLARAQLDGALEARATERRRDLRHAADLWQSLADDPDHADEARQRLASEPLQHWLPWLADGPGREHLWIAPEPALANGELLIVLSCLESRHGFAQVRGLQRALPGHHLLFVHNPEFNWYSAEVTTQLDTLVRVRVLPQFAPMQVTCYFGSMGGHGALKLATRFGFRAVVFNAQTALDLWAAFRPHERQRLWAVADGARIEVPVGRSGSVPSLYLAVGSDTADREALTLLIASLRRGWRGQCIVEKFPDPFHAGLVRRIARRDIPDFLVQASARLAALHDLPEEPPGMVAVAPHQHDSFWDQLDAAAALKVEIVWRSGRLYIAESTRCGTVPV